MAAALLLAACSTEAPADNEAPADESRVSAASIDGEPAAVAAGAISKNLAASITSAADQLGEVGINLLPINPAYTSLMYVDPAEPDTRHRSELRDSTWSAIEAAPGLLGINKSRLSHVSIAPDENGGVEYLVALATEDSLGRVTFGPDGQKREVKPPL